MFMTFAGVDSSFNYQAAYNGKFLPSIAARVRLLLAVSSHDGCWPVPASQNFEISTVDVHVNVGRWDLVRFKFATLFKVRAIISHTDPLETVAKCRSPVANQGAI